MGMLVSDAFCGSVLTVRGIEYINRMVREGNSIRDIIASIEGDLPHGAERIITVFARVRGRNDVSERAAISSPKIDDVLENVSVVVPSVQQSYAASAVQTVESRPLTADERARVRELALMVPDLSCEEIAERIGIPHYYIRTMAAYVAYDRRSRKR